MHGENTNSLSLCNSRTNQIRHVAWVPLFDTSDSIGRQNVYASIDEKRMNRLFYDIHDFVPLHLHDAKRNLVVIFTNTNSHVTLSFEMESQKAPEIQMRQDVTIHHDNRQIANLRQKR